MKYDDNVTNDITAEQKKSETGTNLANENNIGEFYQPKFLKKCLLPNWCQTMIFALVLMCLSIIGQGMVITGQLPITLTMLERNFGFNSIQTGSIHSFYDLFFGIGALTMGILVKKRKIFYIGIGVFIMSIGCFLFTLPHFFYNYNRSDVFNNASMNKNFGYEICNENRSIQTATIPRSNFGYLMIFCLGYSLIGFGSAPLHTSALVYFDENLTPEMNGLYLGIYYLFGAIGPAIGFGLGKPLLSLPVNLNTDVSSVYSHESESWIGAWWLGYIIAGCYLITVSGLLVLYPSRIGSLSKVENKHNGKVVSNNQFKNNELKQQDSVPKTKFKIVLKSIRILLMNTPYLLIVLGMSIKGAAINGLGTFLPKIFEVLFRVSASNASLLTGILAICGGGLGCFLGGLIMKIKGQTIKNSVLIVIAINLVASLMYMSFLFGCDTRKLGKVNLDHKLRITDNTTHCQAPCQCRLTKYEPVCEEAPQITHISPCLAGCLTKYDVDGKLHFTKCQCLDSLDKVVVQGGCISPCDGQKKFMAMAFFALFMSFLAFVPEISIMIQYLFYKNPSRLAYFEPENMLLFKNNLFNGSNYLNY